MFRTIIFQGLCIWVLTIGKICLQTTSWTPPGFDHTHRLLSGKFHRLNNITHRKKGWWKRLPKWAPPSSYKWSDMGALFNGWKSMGLQALDQTWRPVPARGLLGALLFERLSLSLAVFRLLSLTWMALYDRGPSLKLRFGNSYDAFLPWHFRM